jgi:hypothetical protein
MAAVALDLPIKKLKRINTYDEIKEVIDLYLSPKKKATFGINKGSIQFANPTIMNGFLNELDYRKRPSLPKQIARIADMAAGISAAKGIRKFMGSDSAVTTYMTGDEWPSKVAMFQVSSAGFKSYNSADIVVSAKVGDFNGISLKKKDTTKAANPTLINKAFDSIFMDPKFDEVKESLYNARVNYFGTIVRNAAAMKDPIIDPNDIVGDFPSNYFKKAIPINEALLKKKVSDQTLELFKSKKKNKEKFQKKRAYIDTKGWATNEDGSINANGYFDSGNSMTDPRSMRTYVNKQLAIRPNPLWDTFATLLKENGVLLGGHLINIILKQNLFKELTKKGLISEKFFKNNKFNFALVTGIGISSGDRKKIEKLVNTMYPKTTFRKTSTTKDKKPYPIAIANSSVLKLKTTLCGLGRIDAMYPGDYNVIPDDVENEKSDAAKIFFKLVKGSASKRITVINLNIRYKGSFTPQPQFQGGISDEFLALVKEECS